MAVVGVRGRKYECLSPVRIQRLDSPFDTQINHFVECIEEDRQSHCNVADSYRTHELCLAIDRSIEEGGQTVRLPLE